MRVVRIMLILPLTPFPSSSRERGNVVWETPVGVSQRLSWSR